jgi:hypothetical protein
MVVVQFSSFIQIKISSCLHLVYDSASSGVFTLIRICFPCKIELFRKSKNIKITIFWDIALATCVKSGGNRLCFPPAFTLVLAQLFLLL